MVITIGNKHSRIATVRGDRDWGCLELPAKIELHGFRQFTTYDWGTRWRSCLRHCATSRKVADSDSRWCHWNFSLTWSFRPHYGPGVDAASNRNEYQEYFLGVNAAGAYGWQPYHLYMPTVLKSGSLNLLEPSGTVQACNGIALLLYTYDYKQYSQYIHMYSVLCWIWMSKYTAVQDINNTRYPVTRKENKNFPVI